MCFSDNDQRLWEEDPHEYVRKGYGKWTKFCFIVPLFFSPFYFNVFPVEVKLDALYSSADIIEDLYSPRTAAMDFVSELVRKRGKENLHKFIVFIVDIFKR